jgi:predicted anti-sigma-YlaC factor YlaD
MNDVSNRECGDVRIHIVEHLRGDSGRMRERVERHLAGCAECRESAAFIRTLEQSLAGGEPGARLGFEQRLEAVAGLAERRADPFRRQGRFLTSVLGTAAALIAVFGGLLPPVQEALRWVLGIMANSPIHVAVGSAILLLISSPLLLTRVNKRLEESS